jgi:large subunit ribosomal protein L22
MRLVVDLIRGKGVEEALSILHFSPNHAAKEAEKTLRSAVSNLQNQEDSGRIDFSQLYVKEAYVDGGPTLKRIMPAPQGRAFRIRKRSNHLTIVVAITEKVLRERRTKDAKARDVKPKEGKPKAAKPKEEKPKTADAKAEKPKAAKTKEEKPKTQPKKQAQKTKKADSAEKES